MLRIFTTLIFGLVVGLTIAHAGIESEEPTHAIAVRLVMEQRAAQVLAIDPAKDWWHDTKRRTWSAQRPYEPGISDSTHFIHVTYEIDGRTMASWNVNTKTRQVADPGQPLAIG